MLNWWLASAVPRSRLIAPGPSVAEQTPALSGEAAVGIGHEGRRLVRGGPGRSGSRTGLSASMRWMFSSPGFRTRR